MKIKKIIITIGLFFSLFGLIACSTNKKDDKKDENLTYNVYFSKNGHGIEEIYTIYNTNVITHLSTLTDDEYIFLGWYYDIEFSMQANVGDVINSDVTLYAKWTLKATEVERVNVTFDTQGGSSITSVEINKGSTITKPADPTKDGYEFVGWQLNGEDFNFDTIVENDITLVAVWRISGNDTPDPVKYTVTFNTDGGSLVENQIIDEGQKASKPADPTKVGYKFVKWLLNGEEFDFDTPINSNITLTASWIINKYTVKFDTQGGSSIDDIEIEYNGKVTKPADPTKTGYVFAGWYNGNTLYDFNSLVTSDITLVAVWKKYEIVENIINLEIENIYDKNKSKTDSKGKLTEDITDSVFKLYTGVRLESKYVNTQGVDIDFILSSKISNSIKIVGTGASTSSKITIIIQKLDGNNYVDIKSFGPVANGEAITCELDDLEAGNYKLKTNASLRISEFKITEMIEKELEIEYFIVTYDTQGGSKIDSQKVEKNSFISNVLKPVKDGYSFVGWYLEDIKFNFDTPITKDITLVAKWEKIVDVDPNQCIVMFDTNGGSDIPYEVIEKGGKVNMPNEPTRNGYTFLGWYLDDEEFDFDSTINNSIELVAKWSRNKYNISFNNNGRGDKPQDIIDVYEIPENLPVLTDNTMAFVGWYVDSILTTKVNPGDMLTDDLTLYAKWVEKGSLIITEAQGHLESAYIKWNALNDCDDYNVYYKRSSESDSSYRLIDKKLIRQYPNYYRADVLGLAKGSYNIKVVAVYNNTEANSAFETVNVLNHVREGYAFVEGTSSGAYNEDGTIKADANIIYITNENKDSVTLDVDGSAKTGLQSILNAHKYKNNIVLKPLCVRLIGNITDFSIMEKGDLLIDGAKCGITIEGVGDDATANGWGLRIKGASNIEVRNIGFMNCNSNEGDDLGLQQDNDHVWVHNCDFFYGDAGSDSDQAKGDGALDTKQSSYVTHSYNHFWDNGKCNLQGMKKETESNFITYHHNWYDHSDSRHPRIRTCTVHIYNNYFDGNAKYGVGVTMGASAFVENNYYRNCKNPMLSSKQGTDALGEGTFSGENGGIIKAYGNYIVGGNKVIYYQENNTSFDAYLASSRNEKLASSIVTVAGGTAYNNFDTSSDFYKYNVQTPEEAKTSVMKYAGRINGGDFKFVFDNEKEDSNYQVIPELKTKLSNYKSELIRVLGE